MFCLKTVADKGCCIYNVQGSIHLLFSKTQHLCFKWQVTNLLLQNYLAHAEGKAPTPQGTPQGTPHGTPQAAAKIHSKTESERLPPSGAETPQPMAEHEGQNAPSQQEPLR